MRRLFTVLAAAVLLLTACAPGEGDASASAPTSSAGVEQSAQGTCIFTDSLGNTAPQAGSRPAGQLCRDLAAGRRRGGGGHPGRL